MDDLSGRLVANVGALQSLLAKLPGMNAFPRGDAGCMGGVMGAGMRMGGTGLSMGNVQSVTWKFIAYASEKVGGDGVGEFAAVIAARAQFV
jgi:hypothetical protein